MSIIKRIITNTRWELRYNLLRECWAYFKQLRLHNASLNTNESKGKMQYTLLRENHVIEKGMSMRHPKLGFGQEKVQVLIARLGLFYQLHGDKEFLIYPLTTIKSYIAYTKSRHVAIDDIEENFTQLLKSCSINVDSLGERAGIKLVDKEEIQRNAADNFAKLVENRHSIRYFSNELPSRDKIEKALALAQRTPSACNRQAWRTHVYFGEYSHRILTMQGGCHGFTSDIHCSIVVTADMNAFLAYEPFQQYVDGGLYAMNLINALQSVGLGTIPLSCGFYRDRLRALKGLMSIPANETLIVIIGLGELLPQFNVAVSSRKDITYTNTYHS